MPNFTQYQPPGVFVEEELTSSVNVTGARPTVVALVGPSIGYRTYTETVVMEGIDPIDLAQLGIDLATVTVTGTDGTVHEETTDYTLATGTDPDVDPATITRVDAAGITDGDQVFVSYQYTAPDYHTPKRFTNFADVESQFGPALDIEAGTITSPLSFAAKFAFENGSAELVLVSTTSDPTVAVPRAELSAAYTKLSSLFDVNVIVPVTSNVSGTDASPGDVTSIATDLEGFLATEQANESFRVGVIGFDVGVTVDPVTIAQSVDSKRVVLAYPNSLSYFHGFTNTSLDVGGTYLAAAYAGRLASLPVQMPLTRKRVYGFQSITPTILTGMTKSAKNSWSQKGVAVTELTRQGLLKVRHGTTTSVNNMQNRELSLVRARDALVQVLQESMDAADLVGSFIDEDTTGQVKGVVAGVLEAAKDTEIIIDYINLAVRQLSVDPSVIEVRFQYRPAYPLNYIVIVFSINTETGDTEVLDQPAAT